MSMALARDSRCFRPVDRSSNFMSLKLVKLKGIYLILDGPGEGGAVKAVEHAVVAQVLSDRQAPGKIGLGSADVYHFAYLIRYLDVASRPRMHRLPCSG